MVTLALKPDRLDAGEFDVQPLSVCGKAMEAHVSGALYWPAEDALIVADLHLAKGATLARRGTMLPPYDTRETLARLAAVIDHYRVRTIIALGDSLHASDAGDLIDDRDVETLRILQEDREWIWITGNHDPRIPDVLGGVALDEIVVEGIALRHVPANSRTTHEVAAHLHPAARLSLHGHTFRRPCFVSNGLRVVMPAFGTYAGGLNVLDEAFGPLFGNDGICVLMLGQEGLYPVASRLLKAD